MAGLTKSIRRRTLTPVLLAAWSVSAGCLSVPVHVQPQVQGPESSGLMVDPSVIQPGLTTREEMLKNWGWSDVHIESNRLFIGEMKRSTAKRVDMLGGIPVEVRRDWEDQFLFVEFDEKGVVTKSHFVHQNHSYSEMVSYLEDTRLPPLDFSKPYEIPGGFGFRGPYGSHEYNEGSLVLSADAMEYIPGPKSRVQSRVRIEKSHVKKLHPGLGFHSLELRAMPKGQNRLEFDLEPAKAFTFLRYLQQVAPAALRSGEPSPGTKTKA